MSAIDYDALHPLSDTGADPFVTFAPALPFVRSGGGVAVELPQLCSTLPSTVTLYVAARVTIIRAHHDPNRVGEGGTVPFKRSRRGSPLPYSAMPISSRISAASRTNVEQRVSNNPCAEANSFPSGVPMSQPSSSWHTIDP